MAVLLGVSRTDKVASLLAYSGYSLAFQTSDFGNLWVMGYGLAQLGELTIFFISMNTGGAMDPYFQFELLYVWFLLKDGFGCAQGSAMLDMWINPWSWTMPIIKPACLFS